VAYGLEMVVDGDGVDDEVSDDEDEDDDGEGSSIAEALSVGDDGRAVVVVSPVVGVDGAGGGANVVGVAERVTGTTGAGSCPRERCEV
jgi:hypothetical protein